MPLDLQNPDAVRAIFVAGAAANLAAGCRQGSIDLIRSPGTLIATGDLHDNPLHFTKLVRVAGLGESAEEKVRGAEQEPQGSAASALSTQHSALSTPPSHLVLHEIIH